MADWPNDKELEEIYRKGSESHDFQYSPQAWENMEALLDKDKRKRFFLILFLSLGLIISSLVVFFTVTSNSNLDKSEIQEVSEISKEQNPIATPATKPLNNPSIQQLLEHEEDTNISAQSTAAEDNDKEAIKASAKTQNVNTRASSNSTSKPRTEVATENNAPSVNSLRPANTNPIDRAENSILSQGNNLENSNIKEATVPAPGFTSSTDESNSVSISNAATIAFLDRLMIEKLNYDIDKSFKIPEPSLINKEDKFRNYLLSAVVSTESSWTTNGEFSRIDLGLGLKASHFLNRKFALSAGASYVNDVYTAEKGDYNPKSDFFKANDTPEYTSADCSMIELSTGFSYYFSGINRNGFSTSINLLSNFMLKENYNYHYTEEADNFSSSWTMANQTWLNAVDISANYKFNVSDRWILEAGPFLKMPLAGIGHGDVMLSSIGLKFAVGFR